MPQNMDYAEWTHAALHTFDKAPKVPDGSFGDAQISAAQPIGQTKLKHQYVPAYAQPHGTAATTERKVIHVARAAGEVTAIEAGVVVAAVGGATWTVDLRKNGTTILTGVITINNGHAAYAKVAGTLTGATYVTGDVLELVVTATAGGGTLPQGGFVDVVCREGSG